MDSKGKIITKSGREAVGGNSDGCVEEWLQGKAGTTWTSGTNWMRILLYGGLFLLWWWYSQSRKKEVNM